MTSTRQVTGMNGIEPEDLGSALRGTIDLEGSMGAVDLLKTAADQTFIDEDGKSLTSIKNFALLLQHGHFSVLFFRIFLTLFTEN